MGNFSAAYKKAYKQLLFPHGYHLWKGVFYREINDEVLVCFHGKKRFESYHSSVLHMGVDFVPYCADLAAQEYDLSEPGMDIPALLYILDPNVNVVEFLPARINASTDEATLNSLAITCQDIESVVLPYIDRFSDLEALYQELLRILNFHKAQNPYATDDVYGLSLKLGRYDKALIYIDSETARHHETLSSVKEDLARLKNGQLDDFDIRRLKKGRIMLKGESLTENPC